MMKNLTTFQQRAIQYWFADGLAEIGAGLVCLLLAVLFFKWESIFISRWSLFIFFILAFAFSFGLRIVIQRIKEHSTYPRTGYVAPLRGTENKRLLGIAIVFTLLLLAANFILALQSQYALPWASIVGGLVFAFLFAWTGYLTNLHRFFYLAIFCLVAGIALALLAVGYFSSMAILSGLVGLFLLGSGLRARWAYTHQESRPAG